MKKIFFTTLLLFGSFVSAHAVNSKVTMSDTIIIGIIPSLGGPQDPPIVGDWGNQGPHHAPANISLPTVVYDAGTLLYIGTGNASFTYSVVDESEEVWQTGEITLSSGQETSVSVASLPAGDYYLIIAIAGREYEGEFTIE